MKMRNRVLELAVAGVLLAGLAAQSVKSCEDEEVNNEANVGSWSIFSSEAQGAQDATSRRYPHFKLAHLMDNNAATPWVFRGQGQKNMFKPTWGKRHALRFDYVPFQPNGAQVDEIRIMNGYNKRPDLFRRNDRVVQIGIGINRKKVKTAFLSDKMGWHSVSVPRQKVSSIVIEMIGVRKGRGPDNDICISEIAFYDRGKRIR